ncbi:MAG: PAS domain S-box protein, partial [Deltaproteobacteria bacterium]|nr:PAS domain S-box protein [Deltaproteobacteria bacterium]
MPNIRHSLTLRIAGAVAILILILGISLYLLVLTAISGFVQDEIERDLQSISHNVYNICNVSFDDILQSGMAGDPAELVIRQALTLGRIEDFLRQQNLEGLVYHSTNMELLLETNLPLSAEKIMTDVKLQGKTVSLGVAAKGYFAYHFDFSPWNWQLIIVKSESEYADLIAQVQRVHLYTLGLLIFAAFLSAFFLYQSVRRPINAIIEPIKKGRRPEYKGIDVFEFLSDTIRIMMDSLQRSEEKYRSLVETTSDFVWEMDENNIYTYASPTIKDILGYEPEEVIGMTPFDLMPVSEVVHVSEIFREISKNRRPFERLVIENLHRDGQKVVLESSGVPILDAAGNLLGYRGIDRDVTERLRADEESKKLEEQLQHAQRMKSIGTLAGGIAHNFNNLLMGIMGNASIALFDMDPKHPHFQNLKNIEKLSQNGSKLTGQLLGYAREGKYEVKPINLNTLVKETSRTFGSTRKEIRIHRELTHNLFGTKADQGQIEQLLLNLYVNAADAMPGGGDLFLRTANITQDDMGGKAWTPKPGNYALLVIEDTGAGMDKETRARIFEPFFSTKGLAEGTGLGLASVYGTVKSHGGYIDVESEKDSGTTFKVYFPATPIAIPEDLSLPDEIKGVPETVLLIDDEEIVINVGKQMLNAIGCDVLVAGSGKEAIDIYLKNKDKIDIVV